MSYLNASIPPIYCKIRKEYLYDLDKKYSTEYEDCVVFGITSIAGRAILFNILLANGACYWRLPISAFFQKRFSRAEVQDMQIHELELWNCFSYYPSVHCFDYLVGEKGKYLGLDKKFKYGKYLFTIDWAHPDPNILDVEHSEIPKNISVHIYSNLITGTMLLSLIIVFFGILVALLLEEIGLTILSKLQNGLSKIKDWYQKILTECFITWR